MFSLLTNGYYYVWDSILCDRCVIYHVYKRYTAAEWEKIVTARSSKFLDNLEKIIKDIGEIPVVDDINLFLDTLENPNQTPVENRLTNKKNLH